MFELPEEDDGEIGGEEVKQGTVSVLVGCHSPVHSFFVLLSWKKLYGRWPEFWQTVCIFLHDIGHWGKDYLDNYEEKKRHWELGAKIARKLFGQAGYDLTAGHCTHSGAPRSRLHYADKYSWTLAPYWWLMTHRTFEPKLARPGMRRSDDVRQFMREVRENVESGRFASTHDIWLNTSQPESK